MVPCAFDGSLIPIIWTDPDHAMGARRFAWCESCGVGGLEVSRSSGRWRTVASLAYEPDQAKYFPWTVDDHTDLGYLLEIIPHLPAPPTQES